MAATPSRRPRRTLAIYPREPVTRATADVIEPAACDGRESLPERGDGSAAVVAHLRAGRPAVVQVRLARGRRCGAAAGDARRERVRQAPAAGRRRSWRRAADRARRGDGGHALPARRSASGTRPSRPAPAPATVWRRVAVPGPGAYAVAADGAAQTVAVFRGPTAGAARAAAAAVPGGDGALACADRADEPAPLGVVAAGGTGGGAVAAARRRRSARRGARALARHRPVRRRRRRDPPRCRPPASRSTVPRPPASAPARRGWR